MLTPDRFHRTQDGYEFKTSWHGIPTQRFEISYYALSLPENTIPKLIRFDDPRSNREFRKSVGKDLRRNCFVVYLECRSSHGSFDFDLHAQFSAPTESFWAAEYSDSTTTGHYASPPEFGQLSEEDRVRVQNFFLPREHAGDVYITQQAGAVGPNANVQGVRLEQFGQLNAMEIDLPELAQQLAELLRIAGEQEGDLAEQKDSLACAKLAAQSGDSASVEGHLRKAGHWALDLANAAGATIAAAAISAAIGL